MALLFGRHIDTSLLTVGTAADDRFSDDPLLG
jgi:hypothetical protein